jgi:methionine synthase I (cobalamin-dependent)
MNFSRINDKIILIDGGLGTTLQEYGLDVLNDPLWLIILKENFSCFDI